jgi:hypothetical protein
MRKLATKSYRLLYILAWLFTLQLPTAAATSVSKYDADVTKRYPKVQYGPQTTLYREQCEAWVLRLMIERNRGVRNRVQWDASWNTYAGNLLWCQQFPTYREMYPQQQFDSYDVASR